MYYYGTDFEMLEIERKMKDKKIYNFTEITSLSITDYANQYCKYLKLDLKLICNFYNIDGKLYYKALVKFCYERFLKSPRVRVDYDKHTLDLYEQKQHQSITLKKISLKSTL